MAIKHWRDAATVILAARAGNSSPYNFKIMTMKRSSKSKFMPGGYVFPGGNVHQSDSDAKWLDLFKKFNMSTLFPITGNVPEILQDDNNEVPKSVSLRITGIRETFEESGILLCNDDRGNNAWTNFKSYPNLENWRKKIQKDGSEFFNLCKNFNCYPDIKGLQLWSNWLTPRTENTKRFDTLFFLACIDSIPNSHADDMEVENLSWKTPDHLIDIFRKGEIWLPPPQVYELARILNFKHIEELYRFGVEISGKGCERWMPERFKTLDGDVTVLPGDEAYKVDDTATLKEVNEVKLKNKEFRTGFSVLHRIEHTNAANSEIVVKNYKPKYNILPLWD